MSPADPVVGGTSRATMSSQKPGITSLAEPRRGTSQNRAIKAKPMVPGIQDTAASPVNNQEMFSSARSFDPISVLRGNSSQFRPSDAVDGNLAARVDDMSSQPSLARGDAAWQDELRVIRSQLKEVRLVWVTSGYPFFIFLRLKWNFKLLP